MVREGFLKRSLGPEVNFEGKVQFDLAEKSRPGEINVKDQTVYLRQFLICCFIEKNKDTPQPHKKYRDPPG